MSYGIMRKPVEPNPRDVLCKVHLVPNGNHRVSLEQDGSPLGLELTAEEARKAKALLEAALAEINFDDGRTTDRIYPAVKWVE